MSDFATGHLKISSQLEGGAAVITPVGEVDLTASPALRQELKRIQGEKNATVVVDLSNVPYMDSSGVATLVEAMQNARKNKTRLVICGLTPRVRSIFEIAKLETVFTIVATLQDAVKG